MVVSIEALDCPNCEGAERWYWRKHQFIKSAAIGYGADIEKAFVVYALLSTNATVAENDKNYLKWLRGEAVGHFGTVLDRIALAERGNLSSALAFKSGRKITQFRENLRFPWRVGSLPTIDRHAADVVTGDRAVSKNWLARKHGYSEIASLYVEGAERVGWRPHEFQARVWVHHVMCNERKVVS